KDGGLVSAYDAKTGKEVYIQERAAAAGRYYASPVAANGHIYFTSLDDGTVTVLKAGTAKPELIVRNPKLGERVSATPAIADNTLYGCDRRVGLCATVHIEKAEKPQGVTAQQWTPVRNRWPNGRSQPSLPPYREQTVCFRGEEMTNNLSRSTGGNDPQCGPP